MKANELRVGNWYCINTFDINEKRKIETGIDIESITRRDRNNEILPVRLTKKWLINFGFIKNGILTYTNQPVSLVYHKHTKTFVFAFFCGYENLIRIKYVHTLQNLYFSLTGRELELEKQ